MTDIEDLDSVEGSVHELDSRCIFCGDIDQETQSLHKNSVSYSSSNLFSLWEEDCYMSLMELFKTEDSFLTTLKRASYCLNCQNLLRDIDFTTRVINRLQEKQKRLKWKVEMQLTENYQSLWDDEGGEDEEIDEYKNLVKDLYYSLNSASTNEHQYRVLDQKLKRKRKIAEFRKEESEQWEDVQEGCDLDPLESPGYPSVEVVLGDEEEEGYLEESSLEKDDDYDDGDDFVPDGNNSSDEDWESANRSGMKRKFLGKEKEKKKASGKIISKRHVEIGKGPLANSTPDQERRVVWVNRSEQKRKNAIPQMKREPSRGPLLDCLEAGCSYVTSVRCRMEAHVNKEHKGDLKPYHCDQCDKRFGSKSNFDIHKRNHEGKLKGPSFKCEVCEVKKFYSNKLLQKHLRESHPFGKIFRCFHCRKIYQEAKELAEHEALHRAKLESDPYSCVICHSGFTNTCDLRIHVLNTHEPLLENNKCGTCGKVFETSRRLVSHMKTVHTERNPELQCNKCSFLGFDLPSLRRHVRHHENARNHICQHCGKSYKCGSSLAHHLNSVHTDTEEKKHLCLVCRKRFASSCQLKAHEEIHSKEKTYICDECGKAFMTKKNLDQHAKSHRGIKIRYGKRYKKEENPTPSVQGERKEVEVESLLPATVATAENSFTGRVPLDFSMGNWGTEPSHARNAPLYNFIHHPHYPYYH